MAPQASKRRRISGPADTKKKQPTLSFRPTKSGLVAPSAKKPTEYEPGEKPPKVQRTEDVEDATEIHDIETLSHEPRSKAEGLTDPAAEVDEESSEEEEDDFAEALKQAKIISKKQVETYWRNKEKSRKAPRVHQQDLSISEKILREWDLSSRFGVCLSS